MLFFCVAFTVLWPLWVLSQYARIHFRLNPLATIGLVRLGFGVLTGIMLWARQPAAMVLLRIHLAVSAAFSAYSLVTLFHFLVRYGFYRFGLAPIYLSWGITIGFLLAAVIYFSTSERVRATYGSKLFG